MIDICGIVEKGVLAAPERSDDNKKGIVVEKAKSGRSTCHICNKMQDGLQNLFSSERVTNRWTGKSNIVTPHRGSEDNLCVRVFVSMRTPEQHALNMCAYHSSSAQQAVT